MMRARMNFDGRPTQLHYCVARSHAALISTLCRLPQQPSVARKALDHAAVTTKPSKTRPNLNSCRKRPPTLQSCSSTHECMDGLATWDNVTTLSLHWPQLHQNISELRSTEKYREILRIWHWPLPTTPGVQFLTGTVQCQAHVPVTSWQGSFQPCPCPAATWRSHPDSSYRWEKCGWICLCHSFHFANFQLWSLTMFDILAPVVKACEG